MAKQQDEEVRLPEAINHIALLFPNAYLCSADLHGQDATFTIERVCLRKLRTEQGTEQRAVIHFKELDALPRDDRKVFVLGAKVNAKTIAKVLGENDPNKWAGRRITLFPTECEAFGRTVECIRVRAKAPPTSSGGSAAETPAQFLRRSDKQIVADTRRGLFPDKVTGPLTVEETHRLAEAVRKTMPPEPGADSDYDPISDTNT